MIFGYFFQIQRQFSQEPQLILTWNFQGIWTIIKAVCNLSGFTKFSLVWKLSLKTPRKIAILANFGHLNQNLKRTSGRMDVKLSGYAQDHRNYLWTAGFLKNIFRLKVMAQNHSKSNFWVFWSVKYTGDHMTSSYCMCRYFNLLWTSMQSFNVISSVEQK